MISALASGNALSAFAKGFVEEAEKVGIKHKVTWTIHWVRYFELDRVQMSKCKKYAGQNQNATMPDGERWTSTQYGSHDRIG